MGEEAYEETRFVTDSGTVIVRGEYGREFTYLGLSPNRNEDDDPDIVVPLSRSLCVRVAEELLSFVEDGG